MKNSKIYLKVIIVLSVALVLILLFPPYTIEKKDYKFFDFVFNPEIVTKKSDKTYSYFVDSRKRKVSQTDTIDAITVNINENVDTTFNYVQIKELPKRKINPKRKYFEYWDILDELDKKIEEAEKDEKSSEYYRKDIVKIGSYTITEITKHYYDKGYRKLLVTLLIFEILITILLSVIIFAILIFRNSKKVLK